MRCFSKPIGIILCLFLIFSICGCNGKYIGELDNNSTSCGNIVMGNGKFAYDNDFSYFTDLQNIFEYDIKNKKTIFFNSKSQIVRSMFVKNEYIYFACDGLNRISKDGKKKENIFTCDKGCLQLYIDGNDAYYLDSIGGSLFYKNLSSLDEILVFDNVMSYYVDENNIYVIAKDEDKNALFVSEKVNIDFKKEKISFEPIAIFVVKDEWFISKRGSHQIIQYTNGQTKELPITSSYYQVFDDNIIYLDSGTYKNGCFSLMMYNINSNKKTLISENVFDFNILSDNYICMQCYTGENAEYKVYEFKTDVTDIMKSNGK